jgi:hypothetical protein
MRCSSAAWCRTTRRPGCRNRSLSVALAALKWPDAALKAKKALEARPDRLQIVYGLTNCEGPGPTCTAAAGQTSGASADGTGWQHDTQRGGFA